jgi:hypothetical protein
MKKVNNSIIKLDFLTKKPRLFAYVSTKKEGLPVSRQQPSELSISYSSMNKVYRLFSRTTYIPNVFTDGQNFRDRQG